MLMWVNKLLTSIDFVSMILFSFVMFRQKIKPFWKEVSIAAVAGIVVSYVSDLPLVHIAILFVLFTVFLKFQVVPAILIALSGYIMSVIIFTGVIILCDITGIIAYPAVDEDPITITLLIALGLFAKCGVILAMLRFRFGFTFLTNYTTIKLCKENAGFYLFILVVMIGIAYRSELQDNMLSALMPIQMLSMATIIFIYMTLRKELRT
ncbi:hypothetical protein [Paenibacillus sp. SI8]|uniref:hypothetical protein n=1 Tax=unclassified Paenibacillus TaxID=185978 RepID=UPI0034679539